MRFIRFRPYAAVTFAACLAASEGHAGPIQTPVALQPKPVVIPKPDASLIKLTRVPQFPADVKARGDRLWGASSAAVKVWTQDQLQNLARGAGDPGDQAIAAARARWPNQRPAAHNAVAFVLLYKTAEHMREDIKNKLDSKSELGETESLRLQMAMDRLSKFMTALSNILKKISDTAESIVHNLK